jgi:hypothetical protein
MQIDTAGWSGEGDFTTALLEALQTIDGIAGLRVQDSPASRTDAGYLFLSNEVLVRFVQQERVVMSRRWGFPVRRRVREASMTLAELEARLGQHDAIGPADYRDEGMLQYLRTERIVPPYQTRGYKLVEMVRIYHDGTSGGEA